MTIYTPSPSGKLVPEDLLMNTTDHIDNTAGGATGVTTKASSADVVYDHGVATTGIHGAGAKYIALSTTDGLDLSDHNTRHEFLGGDELDLHELLTVKSLPYMYMKMWDNIDGLTDGSSGGTYSLRVVSISLSTGDIINQYCSLYWPSITAVDTSDSRYYVRMSLAFDVSSVSDITAWFGFSTSYSAPSTTTVHAAFYVSGPNVYSSCGNGSAGTQNDIGDLSAYTYNNFYLRQTAGTTFKFYMNGVLKDTITTNTWGPGNYPYPLLYIKTGADADKIARVLAPVIWRQG